MSRFDSDLDHAEWLNPEDKPDDSPRFCDSCGVSYVTNCLCGFLEDDIERALREPRMGWTA
jgi:hypothetical protein